MPGQIAKPVRGLLNRAHPLARGLLYAYAIDEGSGTSLIDQAGQQTLTQDAAIPWSGSPWGSALSFSSFGGQSVSPSGNPISWSAGGSTGTPITVVSAIVPQTGAGGGFGLFEFGFGADNLGAYAPYADNVLYWDYANSSGGRISVDISSYVNTPSVIALTNDGSSAKAIWVNGKKLTSNTTSNGGVNTTFSGFHLGTYEGRTFAGLMALFLLYNRVLLDSEIQNIAFDPFLVFRTKTKIPRFAQAGASPSGLKKNPVMIRQAVPRASFW